jgi:hypothetical protein
MVNYVCVGAAVGTKVQPICQTAKRSFLSPEASYDYVGSRCVRAAAQ